jgi:hypothetical protein
MRTTRPNPPLSPPSCWNSLNPTCRTRLLALLGAMVLEALRAPPHAAEVKDDHRQR